MSFYNEVLPHRSLPRVGCKACSDSSYGGSHDFGVAQVNAKTFLEKRYSEDMELEDAIHTALLTLKEGFEGQISGSNIEVCGWPRTYFAFAYNVEIEWVPCQWALFLWGL